MTGCISEPPHATAIPQSGAPTMQRSGVGERIVFDAPRMCRGRPGGRYKVCGAVEDTVPTEGGGCAPVS